MSVKHAWRGGLAFVASLALMGAGAPGRAGVITSTFDAGDEGWTTYLNGGGTVAWSSTGGNPGGYISSTDVDNDWGYLAAPSKYLVPAQYGGSLSFDLRVSIDDPAAYPLIYDVRAALVGGGLVLINESTPPTTSWAAYGFTLDEFSGWRVFSDLSQDYSPAAPAATQGQIQAVLANLTGLYIAADYTDGVAPNGVEQTDVDNIRLDVASAVPEPGGVILLGCGALALAAFSTVRRLA